MIVKLDEHISYIKNFKSKDIDEIESLKIQFLGRKGIINDLFSEFKNVPPDQKKEYGQNSSDYAEEVNNHQEILLESVEPQKVIDIDLKQSSESS